MNGCLVRSAENGFWKKTLNIVHIVEKSWSQQILIFSTRPLEIGNATDVFE